MNKYKILSCVLIALAVVLGAFGAHAWKDALTGHESTYDTAHQYHLAISIGLLTLCSIGSVASPRWMHVAVILIVIGMLFFSGSLYMLSFPDIFSGSIRKVLGPITPIGGFLMITGWIVAAYSISAKN